MISNKRITKAPISLRGCSAPLLFTCNTCANTERFVRGGPTLTPLFSLMRGGVKKFHYKRAIIGPPAKAFCWRADNGPTLDAGFVVL